MNISSISGIETKNIQRINKIYTSQIKSVCGAEISMKPFKTLWSVGAGTNVLNASAITAHNALIAGQFQDDQMQGHWHRLGHYNSSDPTNGGTGLTMGSVVGFYDDAVRDPITDKVNGTPRTGETTHGKQLGINYQIKY